MVYPYLTEDSDLRQKLIDNKIFVAKYWPNVQEWAIDGSTERKLVSNLLPLPVDQRYGKIDIHHITSTYNIVHS